MNDTDTIAALETAIATLQVQRSVLGDAAVDAALAGLHERLAALGGDDLAAQQLKQVTVLFVDVVGSTALSQRLDAEDINAVMDGALAQFTALVESRHGRVLQYAGDSLLAVFGTPKAREDDAERAVLAGLAILVEGRAQAAAVAARHGGEGFGVRVGIHTGGVLLGGGVDGENSIRGMTVNIAARMEQTAPAGAMRISQDTFRQVRGRFELLEQPPLFVKGCDDPMVTYLVQSARAAPDHSAARGVDGVKTRMVGRDAQLALLQSAWTALAAGGHRRLQCIVVVGDAGLGKSRLVGEFRHWAELRPAGVLWLQAYASEQRMSEPYGSLRQLLLNRLDVLDSDPAAQARSHWLAAATPLLASREDAAVLGHLLGFDFAAHAEMRPLLAEARLLRDRAFFHASQLLRALATRGAPLVAVIDDLHWADDGTLDFLDYLLASHDDLPLLLVALSRHSLLERRPGWGEPHPQRQRVDLAALDALRAGELVDAMLSRLPALPSGLHALIADGAEGNPFYMEELVNMLIDQGVIETGGDVWQLHIERLQALKVPGTLVGVLQARLDALPAGERRTAQLASVVGYRFWDDSLVALGAPLPGGLQGLVDRELTLREEPSSLEGMQQYAFKHHTLHQVTYENVLKRIKLAIHAKVARWLVALPGATPLDLVAEHFERGGEPALALDHWQRAAEAASARFANAQALAHAGRALALVDADDLPRRYALTVLRCTALEVMSDREQCGREVAALQSLAERLADPVLQSEAWFHRSRLCSDGGDEIEALAHARRAVDCAPESAPLHAARARSRAAQCLLHLGRQSEALAESTHALRLARAAGDAATEGTVLNNLAILADDRGDYGASIALYEQALARHREVGHRNNEAGTLSNLGYTALTLGDYDAACAQFGEARERFARIGKRQNEGITLINLGIARLNQGRPVEASAHAREALRLLRAVGDRWAEAAALRVLGQSELAQSDAAAATENLVASRDLFESLGMRHLAMEPMAALAGEALARSDVGAALAQVEAILAMQEQGVHLEGTEEPMRLHLICHQVLAAAADARALPVLESAYRTLAARAQAISDPARRQTYLQAVPYHREIVAAWTARPPGAGAG